jgi:hypothetical protein
LTTHLQLVSRSRKCGFTVAAFTSRLLLRIFPESRYIASATTTHKTSHAAAAEMFTSALRNNKRGGARGGCSFYCCVRYPATSNKHSYLYCCVRVSRFPRFNNSRMGETRHIIIIIVIISNNLSRIGPSELFRFVSMT